MGSRTSLAAVCTTRSERIRRSAQHLARALRIAHIGSIEQGLRTGAIEWSGETYRIFGLDPNLPAPVGKAFLALVHPDDRAACETQESAHQAAAACRLHDMPRVDLRFRIVQPGGATSGNMSRRMGRKSTSSLIGATPGFAIGPRSSWRSWM